MSQNPVLHPSRYALTGRFQADGSARHVALVRPCCAIGRFVVGSDPRAAQEFP
jgi:hypothetical protein